MPLKGKGLSYCIRGLMSVRVIILMEDTKPGFCKIHAELKWIEDTIL